MVRVTAWQIEDVCPAHNKYYRCYLAGSRIVFQYGRIGTVQSCQVLDLAHPAAAVAAGAAKLTRKTRERGKHYTPDGPELLLEVPEQAWAAPGTYPAALDRAFEDARAAGTQLPGSLTDGRGHVVAVAPVERGTTAQLPAGAPTLTHPGTGVRLAVLTAAQAAAADASLRPRVALVDLGAAEDGDTEPVLAAALRMWTPASAEPQSRLEVCLANARMIFAAPTG